MKTSYITALFFSVLIGVSWGQDPQKQAKCDTLDSCLEILSRLSGKRYVFAKNKLRGQVATVGGFGVDQKTADYYASLLLYLNDYARIVLPTEKDYLVVEQRVLAEHALRIINIKSSQALSLPFQYDWYQVDVTVEHPEILRPLRRILNKFKSRYAQITLVENTGIIQIREIAPKLLQMFNTIKKMDAEVDKRVRKLWQKDEERVRK